MLHFYSTQNLLQRRPKLDVLSSVQTERNRQNGPGISFEDVIDRDSV